MKAGTVAERVPDEGKNSSRNAMQGNGYDGWQILSRLLKLGTFSIALSRAGTSASRPGTDGSSSNHSGLGTASILARCSLFLYSCKMATCIKLQTACTLAMHVSLSVAGSILSYFCAVSTQSEHHNWWLSTILFAWLSESNSHTQSYSKIM
jgi:hypothetical protein